MQSGMLGNTTTGEIQYEESEQSGNQTSSLDVADIMIWSNMQ
jgi:hypothetical protein